MNESIIRPVITISSILSTLSDSSIQIVHQKLASDYKISASRLITAALLSISADNSVDLNKLKKDIIGIRNDLQQKSKQTLKSINTSSFENSLDDDVTTYMATFWTDKMFNDMVLVNKKLYVMINKTSCIASVNFSKQLCIDNQTNAKLNEYNGYQITRMYHNIHSINLLFSMNQRRKECDFPSSLEKEDFEIDINSNVIHVFSKLKNIVIGEDSFVMVKQENLNQIVKRNKHLNTLTLSLTNPNYRNGVKVDAITSFLNHEDKPAAISDQLKLKTMKIEYDSDGSDNSKKIASVAIEHSFVKNVCHLDLSGFHDDSGSLNNVKFPQIVAEKSVHVLTLPKTCTIDLQSQNSKDIQSQLNIEKLMFELSTNRAKSGIRLMMNENNTFKYGYDSCVNQDNKSEHLYAIHKLNESLNLHNSVTTAAVNVDIDLMDSYSIDTIVDIFWENEYARYRNRFLKLENLTLHGLTNGDVTVRRIPDGQEVVQNYTDVLLNNICTLKGKMDKDNKVKPSKLEFFTTKANIVVNVDDFDPVRTPALPRQVSILCQIPSLSSKSKKQLKHTIIPNERAKIRRTLNLLHQSSVNDFNHQMIVVWHVNIKVECKL